MALVRVTFFNTSKTVCPFLNSTVISRRIQPSEGTQDAFVLSKISQFDKILLQLIDMVQVYTVSSDVCSVVVGDCTPGCSVVGPSVSGCSVDPLCSVPEPSFFYEPPPFDGVFCPYSVMNLSPDSPIHPYLHFYAPASWRNNPELRFRTCPFLIPFVFFRIPFSMIFLC